MGFKCIQFTNTACRDLDSVFAMNADSVFLSRAFLVAGSIDETAPPEMSGAVFLFKQQSIRPKAGSIKYSYGRRD